MSIILYILITYLLFYTWQMQAQDYNQILDDNFEVDLAVHNDYSRNNQFPAMEDDYFVIPMRDSNNNGQIQNSDANTTILQIGISGYNNYDVDMNGQVQNADVNVILQNVGKGQQF